MQKALELLSLSGLGFTGLETMQCGPSIEPGPTGLDPGPFQLYSLVNIREYLVIYPKIGLK